MGKYLFILDNGHGKDTPGKRSPEFPDGSGRLFEYEFNRDIVEKITDAAKLVGLSVHVLVPEIRDISLEERCRRIEALDSNGKKKIVISVHGNAYGEGEWNDADGFAVFTTPGQTKSDLIATIIYEELLMKLPDFRHRTQAYSDGDPDHEAKFYIIKQHPYPAVLTENGFMTCLADAKEMRTQSFRRRVAVAHVNAMIRIDKEIKL